MPTASERIAVANRRLARQVRARVLRIVRSAAGTFDALTQDEIDRFVAQVVPAVQGGQVQIASLTTASLAAQLSEIGIDTGRIPLDRAAAVGQRGVDYSWVYARPGIAARTELASGKAKAEALAAALNRAYDIAAADLQLARTHTTRSVMSRYNPDGGFRRVLQGAENCAMCIVASTWSYKSGDLMPLHPGCDCSTAPLPPGIGTGRIIDQDRLDEVRGVIEAEGIRYGDRAALANTTIRVNTPSVDAVTVLEHGELGPILGVSRHRNVDPADLPTWRRRSRREF